MLNTKQKYPKFHSMQMQLRTSHPIIPLPTTFMRSSAALWDGQLQAADQEPPFPFEPCTSVQ